MADVITILDTQTLVIDGTPGGQLIVGGGTRVDVIHVSPSQVSIIEVVANAAHVVEIAANAAHVVEIVSTSASIVSVGQQGPPGLPGAIGVGPSAGYSAENRSGVSLPAGCPVTPYSPGGVGFIAANASSAQTRSVGLLASSVGPGFAAVVQTSGVMALSDWTAIVGTVSLVVGARYFLDSTPGRLTTTSRSVAGQLFQQVGEAVLPGSMLINNSICIIL